MRSRYVPATASPLAGDDGVAVLEKQTKLLPAGRVRFEFGTNQDVKRKATKDYDGRRVTASPNEVFVFAIPRRWQGKSEWASERRAEGVFRDVIVFDADDLDIWLQSAPSTHLWISERLGLRPRDAITLETWWSRFSTSTEPVLPVELFKAGRAAQAQRLRSFLHGVVRVISIETEWTEDALGFITAALTEDGAGIPDGPSPIIVSSAEVWDRIVASPGSGTLIPLFDDPDVDRAINGGRHVVGILDSTTAPDDIWSERPSEVTSSPPVLD